jgi:putative drug exporter of the RND superfamily
MGRALFRLGRYCAAHPWRIVLAWIVMAAGLTLAVHTVGSLTSNDLTLPGTQSQQASDLLAANFPPQQNGSSPIVFHVRTGEITTGANKNAVEASYQALAKASVTGCVTFQVRNGEKVAEVRYHNSVFPGTTAEWRLP